MPKCNLSIQLDEPDRVYTTGEKVKGVVRVDVDADVNCNGLGIKSGWKTHGRGNVSSGESETITAFSGTWKAGQQAEYPFALAVNDWPPTYHGHYLNVDHGIDARAKIPWGFDPKASAAYQVRISHAPETLSAAPQPPSIGAIGGCLTGLIVSAVVGVVATLFVMNLVFTIFVFVALAAVGILLVVRYVMPKMVLGDVSLELDSDRVHPGETLKGRLSMSPRKSAQINAITAELHGEEYCVSGSGSNRKTHRHELFKATETLQSSLRLQPGRDQSIALKIQIPATEAYSFDLGDNEIRWTAKVRIDIPRWPDWYQTIKLSVVPAADTADDHSAVVGNAAGTASPMAEDAAADITFAETAEHLFALRGDRDRVEVLTAAVTGLTFPIEAFVERRLLYAGDDAAHLDKDGYAVWAHYTEPALPMVLYVPRDMADDFEQVGRDLWRGSGTIVGWDSEHRRLQIKLVGAT